MLVLQYVEQKEKVQVIKWGGLLPILSFGSRHCSGVLTGRAWYERQEERTHASVTRKACSNRLPLALYRDRGLFVTTEMAHSVLQHRLWCRDRELGSKGFRVATQFWCCDKGAELMGWFCVATQSLCRDSGERTGATEKSCRDRLHNVFCHDR